MITLRPTYDFKDSARSKKDFTFIFERTALCCKADVFASLRMDRKQTVSNLVLFAFLRSKWNLGGAAETILPKKRTSALQMIDYVLAKIRAPINLVLVRWQAAQITDHSLVLIQKCGSWQPIAQSIIQGLVGMGDVSLDRFQIFLFLAFVAFGFHRTASFACGNRNNRWCSDKWSSQTNSSGGDRSHWTIQRDRTSR